MQRFLIRRALFIVVSLFGATIVIFSMTRLAHDPRELFVPDTGYGMSEEQWEALGDRMGFNKPIPVQYLLWVGKLLRGDFGTSIHQELEVRDIIASKMGATIQLAVGGWVFAILVGVPLGVAAATSRGTVWDYLSRGFALFGQALPQFWTGIMAILIFAVLLQWLPAGTRGDGSGFNVKYYILPSIVLGWPAAAGIMRLTRSAMLEVLDSEFVTAGRACARQGAWQVSGHLEACPEERADTAPDIGPAVDGGLLERRAGSGDGILVARHRLDSVEQSRL